MLASTSLSTPTLSISNAVSGTAPSWTPAPRAGIEPLPFLSVEEISKGMQRLGLSTSDAELHCLAIGQTLSLASRQLSEIGSALILASALSAYHSIPKRSLTYQDLPKSTGQPHSSCGIPIHCWLSDQHGKCCLHLTLIDGNPGIQVYAEIEKAE